MQHSQQFVDVQVNGYVGKDFNDERLTSDDWHLVCQRMRGDGLVGILATIVTDEIDAMTARLARIVRAREEDELVRELVHGIHIEGPFLSAEKGYVGAHPVEKVAPPNLDSMRRLLNAADGLVRIVTLAPECDANFRITRYLADQGITVAAGHCDPSLDELRAAIDSGVTMFTHLGNGCAMQVHRHDNIIQRTLSLSDRLWISFIGDGIHIPYHALANYLKCVPAERVIITTDAMALAGMPPGHYVLRDREVDLAKDFAVRTPGNGYLYGGGMSMPRMRAKLRDELALSEAQLNTFLCNNAAQLISQTFNLKKARPAPQRQSAVPT